MNSGSIHASSQAALHYPMTFRVAKQVRTVSVVLAICFAAFFALTYRETGVTAVALTCNLLLIPIMAYVLWWAFTAQIVLREDAFELHWPLAMRIVRVADIAGRRSRLNSHRLVIVPKTGSPFSVNTASYAVDAHFRAWLLRLPDLGKIEYATQITQAPHHHAAEPASPESSLADESLPPEWTYLGRNKILGMQVVWIPIMLVLIGMIFGFGRALLFFGAPLLPWGFLLWGWYLRRTDMSARTGYYRSVGPLILGLCFLLWLIAYGVSNLLHVRDILVPGAIVGLLLLLTFKATVPAAPFLRSPIPWLLLGAWAWIYGGCTAALANRIFDTGSPQVYQSHITDKYLVRGKGVAYHLKLAPWGPEPNGYDLQVESEQYAGAKPGDPICMGVYPGRFGAEWTDRVPCPVQPSE
jgi:hypothetical protein